MTFLETLIKDIQAVVVDDKFQSNVPIHENEVVLGELSEEAKKIFIISSKLIDKANALLTNGSSQQSNKSLLIQLDQTISFISELFWITISKQFSSWDKSLGLRQGWQVVSIPEQSSPFLPKSLLQAVSRDYDFPDDPDDIIH